MDIEKKPFEFGHSKWTFRERLPMAILTGLALPFTLFYGAFEMYAGNTSEFDFALGDFAPLLILICVGLAAVLCGVLLAVRGRAFDLVFSVAFWLSVMAYIQANFLNIGIDQLTGDGNGLVINTGWLIGNIVIWVVVLAAIVCAMLLIRQKSWLQFGANLLMIAVLVMQLTNFVVICLSTDVFAPKTSVFEESLEAETAAGENELSNTDETEEVMHMLTRENLFEVGNGKHVLVLLIDRFDVRYVDEIKEHDPDYFDQFADFTYYEDNITAYSRTYPAVASLLSGKENDFAEGTTASSYFENAYQNSPLFKELKAADFSINLYTDDYYCYRNAKELRNIADNISGVLDYRIENPFGLALSMLGLSAYRCVPVAAKTAFGLSTDSFEQYVVYDTEYPTYELRDADTYAQLEKNGLTLVEGGDEKENTFTFLHLWGIHPPYNINADGDKPSDGGSSLGATLGGMNLVLRYIEELKRLGLYENTTIIITGDHPDPINDYVEPAKARLTALFVKRAGVSHPFKESSAQVSQENFIPSILESAGVDLSRDFGESYWEVPEGESRTRHYNFIVNSDPSGHETITRFVIEGDGRDFANWKVEKRFDLNGWLYR